MADIVVSEEVKGAELARLAAKFALVNEPEAWRSEERLCPLLATARALVVRNQTPVTARLLASAPKLEIVARAGVGLDNIDTAAASAAGIVVSYTPDANSISVAELALGLMLALARRIPAAHLDTQGGGWGRQRFTGIELAGKSLGIVGFGRIGALVARRGAVFGMTLLAHDEFLDPSSPAAREAEVRFLPLDDLLAQADIVTCHVPSTPATRGMFHAKRFRAMKPSAHFINTARGELVVEEDLVRALEEGWIAGAALDVRAREPPATGRLEQLPNVVLTPHIAAFTHEAQVRVVHAVVTDVERVLSGRDAIHYFNFARPRPRPV